MKVVIHGYYGAGNIGDDAILESIIDSIFNLDRTSEVTVISRGITRAYYGPYNVETLHVNNTQKVKLKVKAADAVVLGGGGLLQDYRGWKTQRQFGLRAKGMNYYGQIISLANRFHKPVYIYAIGIGPLATSHGRKYALNLLSKARMVTVRDEESFRFMKTHLPDKDVKLTADPALNLKAISFNKAIIYLKKDKVPVHKKLIGICLRPWMFKPGERERLLNRIVQFADKITADKNNHLVLLPFSSYAGDIKIMKDLSLKLKPSSHSLLTRNYQAKVLKGICGQFSLMIGMRLHALILSASSNVPVIGLCYDPKMNHFLQQIGQRDSILSFSSFLPGTLATKSTKLLNMSASRKKGLLKKVMQLKLKEKGNIQNLMKEL